MKFFYFFKTIEFDKKIKLIELIFLLLGILVVFIQLRESNRITWLQAIEVRALELSKLELNSKELQCLYLYENEQINKNCISTFENIENHKKAIVYLDEVLDLFIEVIKYDKEYSIRFILEENEFSDHYKIWYKELFHNKLSKKIWFNELDKYKIDFINNYIYEKDKEKII